MTQRIVYTSLEGNVCVVVPAPGFSAQDCMKDVPAATLDVPEVVPVEDIPSDRTFRNAWKKGEQGKRIGVEMVKAKDITHEKRRAKRAAELAPLDVEATIPSKAAQAEAARQAIRDRYAVIQTSIDAATTPEQLKAIIVTEVL